MPYLRRQLLCKALGTIASRGGTYLFNRTVAEHCAIA